MIRIAVTGPESSGKTTLSKSLAASVAVRWIPEYAREYLEENKGTYEESDLLEMAKSQKKQYESVPRNESAFVSDTELTVFMVWSEDKFKSVNPELTRMWEKESFDLLFLCYPDIPWEPDPLREDPERRVELFASYVEKLNEKRQKFYIIRGENKLRKALEVISGLYPDLLQNNQGQLGKTSSW